jgi:hypothetical protein
MSAKTCKHGLGWVVLLPGGVSVYLKDGAVVSASHPLDAAERLAIARQLAHTPADRARLPLSVIRASLQVAFDEDEDDVESLGSTDTWSDEED